MKPDITAKEKLYHRTSINVIEGLKVAAERDGLDLAKLLEVTAVHLLAARLFSVSNDVGQVPDIMVESVLNRVAGHVKTHVKQAGRRLQPPRMH